MTEAGTVATAPRYDRTRFIALGLLPLLNALLLPLSTLFMVRYGHALAGQDWVPVIGVAMLTSVAIALRAMVRRGRDLGWTRRGGAIAFTAGWLLPPATLGLLLYLASAKAKAAADRFGPAPGPASPLVWIASIVVVATPYAAIAVLNTLD